MGGKHSKKGYNLEVLELTETLDIMFHLQNLAPFHLTRLR
jgi:hypothetical protein